MKQIKFFTVSIIAILTLSSCGHTIPARESILDNITTLEDSLYLELPQSPRLCDAMDIEKRFVDIGDSKLYCEIEGSGTPLVLINGGPGDSHHIFHPWLSELSKGFQVIYYDQRGCGLSDYTPGPGYSFEQAVEDLEKLRISLKIDKWIVAGHSFGGGLAQYYTIKYPQHVLGQVLIGSVPMMDIEEFRAGRAQEYYSEEESEKIAELRAMAIARKISMAQYLFNKDINGGWKRGSFYKQTRERMAQNGLYDFVADPLYTSDWAVYSFKDAFLECPVPTLILEGKYDLIWKADKPALMAKYHPNASVQVLENSGHNMFADEPGHFTEAIKLWAESIEQVSKPELKKWSQSADKIIGERIDLIESSKDFIRLIKESGIEPAKNQYLEIKAAQPEAKIFFEAPMNALGYEYLFAARLDESVEIFELNVMEYPESWNAYDSLGEAYLKINEIDKAKANYLKSIELNPENENGIKILKDL
ncbi:MAG: alpha/beta fold hydrolase [Candidatus Marinimicrobia bacterium]|nr:alpha/beta fold hydrolase [Candidatus Neomarinimicrobiota bacterium]